MPLLRTDDGPRRLRAIWLGPNGATLPFEWTYVQWGVVLLTACTVGNVFGLLAWWWTGDIVYTIAAIVLWGWPAGVYLGTRVMRGVSFDEPLRFKLALHREQLRSGARPPGEIELVWAMPPIRSLELDPEQWGPE